MAGLVVSIGGKLDPSYKAALDAAHSLAEKEAQNLRREMASATLEGRANTAAHLEQERYQRWLEGNVATLKTVKDAKEADTAALLANSAALKKLNAELAENKRLAKLSGARASGIEDSAARQSYMDWWKANTAAPANDSVRQSIRDARAKKAAESMNGSGGFAWQQSGADSSDRFLGGFLSKLHAHGTGGMAQIIHVFRATFDSLVSGMDPWRVFLQQAPQALQAFSMMTNNALKFLGASAGIGTAAIGSLLIGTESYRARKAAEESEKAGQRLHLQGITIRGRIDMYLDSLVQANRLTKEQADHYREQLYYHEGILRVTKALREEMERNQVVEAARDESMAESRLRIQAAIEKQELLAEKNITAEQYRKDFESRVRGNKILQDQLDKMTPDQLQSQTGLRIRAVLEENELQKAVDQEHMKKPTLPTQSFVTERERIGLGAASSIQVSMLDLARKQHTTLMQSHAELKNIVRELQENL